MEEDDDDVFPRSLSKLRISCQYSPPSPPPKLQFCQLLVSDVLDFLLHSSSKTRRLTLFDYTMVLQPAVRHVVLRGPRDAGRMFETHGI